MKKITFFMALVCLAACSSTPVKEEKATSTDSSGVTPPTSDDSGTPPTTVNEVDASQVLTLDEDSGVKTIDASVPPPMNLATCISDCQIKYPEAEERNKQLDATCFLGGTCEPVCNNLKPGTLFQPTATDAGGCDTLAVNSYPITTPSQACSDCLNTTPTCCQLWKSIFGSVDGRGLNECANTCFNDYKN